MKFYNLFLTASRVLQNKKPANKACTGRWGIPGWILLIVFFLLVLLDILLNALKGGASVFLKSNIQLGNYSLASAILVASAGVPVGFLLYQFYFCLRWNSPWAADGIWFIEGRRRGIERTLKGIDRDKFAREVTWRKEYIADWTPIEAKSVIDHKRTWHFLETLFVEAAATSKEVEVLYERSRYLLDMLHALGTTMIAALLGTLLYFLTKLYLYSDRWVQLPSSLPTEAAITLVSISGGILVALIIYSNRSNIRNQTISLHNYILRRIVAASINASENKL